MKYLFDQVSRTTSKLITRTYSTSFSLGIYCLGRRFHNPIYSVYGFVRLADEIVDSMHDYDKETLLNEFEQSEFLREAKRRGDRSRRLREHLGRISHVAWRDPA